MNISRTLNLISTHELTAVVAKLCSTIGVCGTAGARGPWISSSTVENYRIETLPSFETRRRSNRPVPTFNRWKRNDRQTRLRHGLIHPNSYARSSINRMRGLLVTTRIQHKERDRDRQREKKKKVESKLGNNARFRTSLHQP